MPDVTKAASAKNLEIYREQIRAGRREMYSLAVCAGSGCRAMGAADLKEVVAAEVAREQLADVIRVFSVGCPGFCHQGPLVIVHPGETLYIKVKPEDIPEIVAATASGKVVERLVYKDPATDRPLPRISQIPFFAAQTRNLLRFNGYIDPLSIDDYIAAGGYEALSDVLTKEAPGAIIERVERSGLRGRGGAGFSAGSKWRMVREAEGEQKYLICNRSSFDGNAHLVLEGVIIGAFAVGAAGGFAYLRVDNQRAVNEMTEAVKQAGALGLLGENILGSGFSFKFEVWPSSSEAICGEETAMIASIEGERGVPRVRPPYPAVKGLWGAPTLINNAETFANVPAIIRNGPEWFASLGPGGGTKIFSLTGKVRNGGLVELPLGLTVEQIVNDVGGGLPKGRKFKALHIGGASGGVLPAKHLDKTLDYDTIEALGAAVGSGELAVMDETVCIVESVKTFMQVMKDESCGKCAPCRLGTQRMLEILTDITDGRGAPEDIERLEALAGVVKDSSLCGLGRTASNPVLTSLEHFRAEYADHIKNKHCDAAKCKALVKAPCSHTCPAGVDAPSYIALIAQGRYEEAVAVHKERNPFPSICGRVCHHPCEARCRRGELDEPIAIAYLKRFMADQAPSVLPSFPHDEANAEHKVAVVGSGPAGLSCAFYLSLVGYDVTVFESLPLPGGMVQVGIPRFRLPQEILDTELGAILDAGVKIETTRTLGSDFAVEDLFAQGHKAVFLGPGAHRGSRMRLDNEDTLNGVMDGAAFLRQVGLGQPVDVGAKVVVVGGGNVALDAARTALRLGAEEVKVIYRRTEAEMPAFEWDIREAKEEEIELDMLTAPIGLAAEGNKVVGVECQRMRLGDRDSEGRRRPVAIPGETYVERADTVIGAIGQKPDLDFLRDREALLGEWGTLAVGDDRMTAWPGVFGGGDAVRGPASVVEAVGDGQRAAIAIEKYISGKSLIEEQIGLGFARRVERISKEEFRAAGKERRRVREVDPAVRKVDFTEVVMAFSADEAQGEAARCLRCDLDD